MKTQIRSQYARPAMACMLVVFFFIFSFSTVLFAQASSHLPSVLTPTVTCDSVLQTSTCAGGNLVVRFTVSGGSFNFGNVFTAQLSNNFGQFTSPVNIGSIAFNLGFILGTIPANAAFGAYKVRVITSNPVDTSNASPNYIVVTQLALLNQIVASPQNFICPGDTVTLTAVNLGSYSWSTGDTTQSIQVTQPGIYSVTTTDALTCQSTTSDTVLNCTAGVAENTLQQTINVFPNPAKDRFNLQLKTGNPVDADIALINPFGQVLLKTKLHLISNSERSLSVASLSPGVYFLKVQTKDFIETKRIEIIR